MAALASLLQANNEESSNGAEYGSYSDANATDTEAILSTILHMNKGKPHVSASDQSSLFNHYFSIAMRQQQQGLDILNNLGESGGLNVSVSASGTQDFCDICQKQFCNKYYLKKHRIDVHGVVEQKGVAIAVAGEIFGGSGLFWGFVGVMELER